MMLEITSLAALRELTGRWRAGNESVALVPTMGALHDGHLSLVAEAKKHARYVVVSIFVNPTQFGPNEDFSRYPRPLARDLEMLRVAGVDAVWLPGVTEMYPDGFATHVHVGDVSEGMDGAARPGHFDGVGTVVTKLLMQASPHIAVFGEKDYQQLCLIKRLVSDLNIDISILGVKTKRDVDNLALSSRNQYLSAREREIAPALYATLRDTAVRLTVGQQNVPVLLEAAKASLIAAGFASVDYLELRAAETLRPLASYQPPARLLVAARLGTTRLIDNVEVGEQC